MVKQKSLTAFSELTTAELKQITGGNWWRDFIKLFPFKDKVTNSNNKYKQG